MFITCSQYRSVVIVTALFFIFRLFPTFTKQEKNGIIFYIGNK